ncbi:MAG TPA: AsmA family protein [Hyphomicrobiaceae bacterium]|nr:AsmA family protein [Hyphomicrobiaceae bacterium]
MNSLLLWMGGLLVVALCALSGVPHFVDWNSYRGLFEEEASRLLDRPVRVGGSVNVRLLPFPYVRFESVRIADGDAAIRTPFFRAESITLWLAVPPLLKGVIEANEVEVKRPIFNLHLGSEGGGNWQTFKLNPTQLPFVPRDVALQSVKISDGVLAVHRPGAEEMARVEVREGELTGAALEGPYKFRGDIRWNGEAREVRVSTASPDADSSIRFKVLVRVPASDNSYTLDGKVADLALRPRVEGTLTAVVHDGDATPAGLAQTFAGQAAPRSTPFDMRAHVSGDTLGARLEDIALSFEHDGKPQLVVGSADADWRQKLIVRTSLTSRWLDLDRFTAPGGDVSPLATLRRLAGRLTGMFPASGQILASLSIDQVHLGGDVVSGFETTLQQADGRVELTGLKAGLPGGAKANLKGQLGHGNESDSFEGELLLHGASLGRFMAWAAKPHVLPDTKGDGSFSLQSRISLSSNGIALEDVAAEIAGNTISGDLDYRWKDRKQLSLTLQAKQLTVPAPVGEWAGPELSDLLLRPFVAGSAETAPGSPSKSADVIGRNLRLRVRAGQIDYGERTLRDVDAAVFVENGALWVPQMRFVTGTGLTVELQGELKDFAGRPKGTLRGSVGAGDSAALSELLEMVDARATLGDRAGRLTALAPLRLGYVLSVRESREGTAELTLDGTIAANRLALTVAAEGGLASWRESPLDATLMVDGRNLAPVLRVLVPPGERGPNLSANQGVGRLQLKVVGTPAAELVSSASLEADGLGLAFSGRTAWPKDQPPRLDGELQVRRADVARALAFLGVKRQPLIGDVGVEGKVRVRLQDGTLELEPREFNVGGTPVAGRILIFHGGDESRVDARLTAREVSIPRLLGLFLGGHAGASPAVPSNETGVPWPDAPLEFSNAEWISGRLVLEAGSMALTEGLALRSGSVEAEMSPAGVDVTKITGRALGGTISGALKLQKALAGASLAGTLRLTDAQLAELLPSAGGQAPATGGAQASLQFSGQALSPLALVAGLSGQGEVELKGVRLLRLSPGAIETVANAVLSGKLEASGPGLEPALRAALAARPLDLGTRKLALRIVDGAIRVSAFSMEAPEGRASNETTIDLASLKLDSEWKLEPRGRPRSRTGAAGRAALPGISVIYVGPLAALHTLEPRLSFEALERELSVRKMERDVDQLERLRRDDAARAQREVQRLQAPDVGAGQPGGPLPPIIEAPLPLPAVPLTSPTAPARPGRSAPRRGF